MDKPVFNKKHSVESSKNDSSKECLEELYNEAERFDELKTELILYCRLILVKEANYVYN